MFEKEQANLYRERYQANPTPENRERALKAAKIYHEAEQRKEDENRIYLAMCAMFDCGLVF